MLRKMLRKWLGVRDESAEYVGVKKALRAVEAGLADDHIHMSTANTWAVKQYRILNTKYAALRIRIKALEDISR